MREQRRNKCMREWWCSRSTSKDPFSHPRTWRTKECECTTVWGDRLCKRFFGSFPCLCWQLQFSLTVCGTLRKHVTKYFPQPAAPDCTCPTIHSLSDSFSAIILPFSSLHTHTLPHTRKTHLNTLSFGYKVFGYMVFLAIWSILSWSRTE